MSYTGRPSMSSYEKPSYGTGKGVLPPHSLTFAQALAIAAALSFGTPAAVLAAGTLGLKFGTWLPGIGAIMGPISQAWVNVLKVFGSGQPWQGILTIALACALVGSLFEAFVFCQYQGQQHSGDS